MTFNFRAAANETSQIVVSGSSGTNAKLIIYPIDVEQAASPHQGLIDSSLFNTSSIGQDVFCYISGAVGGKNSSNQSIVVAGGDVHISGNLSAGKITGSTGLFTSGLTGALNLISAGVPIFAAGAGITLATGSNGQITIAGTDASVASYWTSTTNDLIFTTGSIRVTGSIYGTLLSGSTGAQLTGSLQVNGSTHITGTLNASAGNFTSGLTGALNVLNAAGTPSLLAGAGITLTTASNGQITVAGTDASVASYWDSTTAGTIFTTGSVRVTGSIYGTLLSGSTGLQITGSTQLNGSVHVTGTLYSQAGKFLSGLTGALNVLPDGSSFILAGTNITTATGSSGQITVNAPNAAAAGSTNQLQLNGGSSTFSASNRLWFDDNNAVLKVSGTVAATSLSASNNAFVTGTLDVKGNTVVSGNINPFGTNSGSIGQSSNYFATIWSNLVYTNAVSSVPFGGYIAINTAAGTTAQLQVNSSPVIKYSSGLVQVSGALDVSGSTYITGTLNVSTSSFIQGDMYVSGTLRVSGGHVDAVTVITGNYTMLPKNYIIAVSAAATYVTATLPANPENGQSYVIKDILGTASTYPITITSSAEVESLDGAAVATIDFNYGSYTFVFFAQ